MFWKLLKRETNVDSSNLEIESKGIVWEVVYLTQEMIAHITNQNDKSLRENYKNKK